MACHDPLGDMICKIRNAILAKQEKVSILPSKEKLEIIKILKNEGYIKNFKKIVEDSVTYIRIFFKYDDKGRPVLEGLKRVSSPGRRIYFGYRDIPRLYNGMGTIIVSTSTGITTGKKAIERKVGGEVICQIW
ncbi:MAG: 30S ribosomal protein S8 [Spirochaetes bacterium GWD1_27_9]|nr:MAG: 30S ribosomal protein S8 [Spirochaetes bacterium GWB1_27_13]OHD21034.1 MAG: 30S ribosomal protein S8 [Spirochaetes bacterium GWC1_27_15]OHD45395.1 MAG: 30S ribosomal protein S8 [Spirochaetes bacterium GWD1_27_9]